jgi:hypothetical protein
MPGAGHWERISSNAATRASGVIEAQNSRSACRSSSKEEHLRTHISTR